jgi:1-acyl-sn-glycerol-3-phosphate acyltransferase
MKKAVSVFSKIFLAPIVSGIFIKKLEGKENLPQGNFILASNHQSYLDIMLSGYVCVPRRFTYIGQVDRENKGFKFMRDFLYSYAEVIPVNRNEPESKQQAFETAVEYLKNGYDLIIYPEGTRTRTGEVQEGKWGVAKLYLRTGVPILPMGINGAYEIFPPGQKPKIKKNIELRIGNLLKFENELEAAKNMDIELEEYKKICASITEKLMEEIKKLVDPIK